MIVYQIKVTAEIKKKIATEWKNQDAKTNTRKKKINKIKFKSNLNKKKQKKIPKAHTIFHQACCLFALIKCRLDMGCNPHQGKRQNREVSRSRRKREGPLNKAQIKSSPA